MQPWAITAKRKAHRSLGLEVTDRMMKLCELHENRKRELKLAHYDICELPEGTIIDGRIKNREEFQRALSELLQIRDRKTNSVYVTIPSSLVMARTLQLPDIGVSELRKVVQYEMKNNLQVAFENPYYDFVKLPHIASDHPDKEDELPDFVEGKTKADSSTEENGSTKLSNVLVVAAPMSELNQYVEAMHAVKLKPASIEISSMSLLRLFETLSLGQLGLHMIVNISRYASEITIIEDGVFRMTRQIEVEIPRKGAAIEADQGSQQVDGLAWFDQFADPEQHFYQSVRELIGEIERIIDFYYYTIVNQRGQVFRRIWVAGELEELDEIIDQMRQQYSVEVALLEWKDLMVEELEQGWSTCRYAVPLGLALRGGER